MTAPDDAIDLAQILAAFGEIDEEVRDMLRLFAETTAPMLETLAARVAARDRVGVEDIAHSAKGAARSAGARALAAACEAVEAAAATDDWSEIEARLASVAPAFAAARRAIARL
jgi:HPt (histidine-containing phosphotransfer) domain-containing protein